MVVGSLGDDIVFEVSEKTVKTLYDVQWKSSANYKTIDRHLKDDLIEFCGNKPEIITFKVQLSASLGINPLDEFVKFLDEKRKGSAMRFVIGWKAYGKYKWCITDLTGTLRYYDNRGNLLYCEADVTLQEYSER